MTVKYGAIWGAHSFRWWYLVWAIIFQKINLQQVFNAFGSYGEFRRSGVVKVLSDIFGLWKLPHIAY